MKMLDVWNLFNTSPPPQKRERERERDLIEQMQLCINQQCCLELTGLHAFLFTPNQVEIEKTHMLINIMYQIMENEKITNF